MSPSTPAPSFSPSPFFFQPSDRGSEIFMRLFEWQRRWSGADSDSRGLGSWHMTANCQRCRRFLLLCHTQVWKTSEKRCNKETTLISRNEAAHSLPFNYHEEVLSLKVAQGKQGGRSEKQLSWGQLVSVSVTFRPEVTTSWRIAQRAPTVLMRAYYTPHTRQKSQEWHLKQQREEKQPRIHTCDLHSLIIGINLLILWLSCVLLRALGISLTVTPAGETSGLQLSRIYYKKLWGA